MRKLKTTEKTLEWHFRKGAQAFLVRVIEKLKFKMTRSISCLSPTEISLVKPELMKNRFSLLVQFLHDDGMVASIAAEKVEKQYSQLICNADFLKEVKNFNIYNDRVDEFYSCMFDSATYVDLENVVGFDTFMGMPELSQGFQSTVTFC